MGARLSYAKVVDRETFYVRHGGKLHPGLDNEIVINGEPGEAGAFLVLRGWGEDHGTFTERWHIEGPGGVLLYESAPREIHLASKEHIERLEDEVADLKIESAADKYSVVFTLDENVVARVSFRVKVPAH
ncbi:MAG: hypothetical protein QOG54_1054 [Actinomycetota bacterium]|nr:hypothetical protein [Actinomycetota bacterium]